MKCFSNPMSYFSYRKWAYGASFLTGFASLCGQVVWQRYLAVLTGSEAKSMSLAAAVFLLGLASGYYYFGKLSEKNWTRRRLMKFYGCIELASAVYFFIFHIYFHVLKAVSFHSPSYLIIDIIIAVLALFLPTFLMGASIPLLTAALPENANEVNRTHAQVYGWNTLGAFSGVLASGFFLMPFLGFALALTAAGLINLLASFVFIGCPLQGKTAQKENTAQQPSSLPGPFLMVFVFFTGAVIISLEILFIRLLNLTLGTGVYNFPIVLSLFIGGLGLGSLLIPKKTGVNFFIRQIILSILFLFISFLTAPYWSIWMSHLRVSIQSIPFNYYFFKAEAYIFLLMFIFPIAFFMGRLLPLAYGFLKKEKQNQGKVCGFLYFSNTLGSVFGAVVLGYIMFYFFDLDRLFQMNIIILISLAWMTAFYEKKKIMLGVTALFLTAGFILPQWDRSGHISGYFRKKQIESIHFQKIFHIPPIYGGDLAFFKDGPNTTVSITENSLKSKVPLVQSVIPEITGNYNVFVNGKSDGSFIGSDFATMVLLSSFAYIFAPDKTDLSSAVVGLGTGLSAGLLGKLKDIKEVNVLEISSQVIQGLKSISAYNFDVMSNPKINIIEQDAFKYFTRTDKKFDFIMSEPSNPWVTGVENLFSIEFYQLVQKKLNKNGVLVQWLHTYSTSLEMMQMMFSTIKKVFPFTEFYVINNNDVLIIAGEKSFWKNNNQWKTRFHDPVLRPIHFSFGLKSPEDLYLLRIFGNQRLSYITQMNSKPVMHSLTHPKLTYQADKDFFLGKSVNVFHLSQDYIFESFESEANIQKQFNKYTDNVNSLFINDICLPVSGFNFFCKILSNNLNRFQLYKNKNQSIYSRFQAYIELRKRGWIPHDLSFLDKVKQAVIQEQTAGANILFHYINQTLALQNYNSAIAALHEFQSANVINPEIKKHLIQFILNVQKLYSKVQHPPPHSKLPNLSN